MGLRSATLVVILVFGVLFSMLYVSLEQQRQQARIQHLPNVIPTEPKLTQMQVVEVIEREYGEQVPEFMEAYLHFNYYNYSQELQQDEQYQRYLRSVSPGWQLSYVKAKPDLLSLPLVFVHANGTVYSIDSKNNQDFEKICEQPSRDCIIGLNGGEAARDRLVYEVGAIVEGDDDGDGGDIHLVIDAETGKVVYSTPYFEPRPALPRTVLDNSYTIKELNQMIENTKTGVAVEIVHNASEIALGNDSNIKGYKPAEVREILFNTTASMAWFNHDSTSHTVTSDNGYVDLLGSKFDSGIIEPGDHFAFVFIEVGYYPYHCEIHPWMKGEVSIVENFA